MITLEKEKPSLT
jgi:hypothetical protein